MEESARAGKEELLMTSGRFSSPGCEEMFAKSSVSPPELPELAAELELAVGREEMLASMFTILELSSMLLERLEFAVRFPKMEKLVRLLLEVLARLLLPIPSMAKLAAVPHLGWEEEELASRSVTLDRFPILKVKVESWTMKRK